MFRNVLIVDDDEALRDSLCLLLAAEGHSVQAASDARTALELLEGTPVDAILCDLRMPGLDDFDLIPQLTRRSPGVPVILMSAHGAEDLASEAIRRGAYDSLAKPFQPAQLRLILRRAAEHQELRRHNLMLQRDMSRSLGDRAIVAASDEMIALLEMLERTAPYRSTVLITGECGTGKEVIARALHAQSPRRDAPFVAVDCAAIPENLLESELFGHAKGAFTGAPRAHRGLFGEAHHGTLFLDEISKLPPALQVKLLRALQEEEILPVGDTKSHSVDVRLIAATARDLATEIASDRFREDLYSRLKVVRLEVPPLRVRRKDIPLLVDHFLAHFRDLLSKDVRRVSDGALERLLAYDWPGNVRELQNVIERAVILTQDDAIEPSVLLPAIQAESRARIGHGVPAPSDGTEDLSMKRARKTFEAELIRRALARTGGNRTHAARLLEISHRALLYKMKDYGIRPRA